MARRVTVPRTGWPAWLRTETSIGSGDGPRLETPRHDLSRRYEADYRGRGRSPAGVEPGPGQAFQGMRRRPGRGEDQAVGPDGGDRERGAALGGLHQAAHPALDPQVE